MKKTQIIKPKKQKKKTIKKNKRKQKYIGGNPKNSSFENDIKTTIYAKQITLTNFPKKLIYNDKQYIPGNIFYNNNNYVWENYDSNKLITNYTYNVKNTDYNLNTYGFNNNHYEELSLLLYDIFKTSKEITTTIKSLDSDNFVYVNSESHHMKILYCDINNIKKLIQ